MSQPADDDLDAGMDPLGAGSASMPDMQGEGCLLRFSPDALNEEMGADFSFFETPLIRVKESD